ncbi:MAG: ferritin-like domain-containing protein [Pseudonocardia sp.]
MTVRARSPLRPARGARPGAAPPLDDATIDALQGALATEHAALWSYALIVAFLPPDQAAQARLDADAHRELRSRVAQTVTDVGRRPVSAQPAYATPQPVTDALSGAALAAVAEADTTAAWRSILERTTYQELRQVAVTTMTASTLRHARWRLLTGEVPAVPDFPGLA